MAARDNTFLAAEYLVAVLAGVSEFAATQELACITATEDTETGDTEEGQG